jgi:hypothetical protein
MSNSGRDTKKDVIRIRQEANTIRIIVNPYRTYRELAGCTAPFFMLFPLLVFNNSTSYVLHW